MIDKIAPSIAQALSDVRDGSTVLIGGFGTAGIPNELIEGLIEQGARDLTVVNNNAGNGDSGLAALLKTGRVRSEEHTSELQSLMRISYAVFCLKKKNNNQY